MKPFALFANLAGLILLTLSACGETDAVQKGGGTVQIGEMTISGGQIRVASSMTPTSAGYMVLTNSGEEADALIAVRSEVAEITELHQSLKDEDGTSLMRKVPAIQIPAGGTVELKPGDYHVMFIRLAEAVEPGSTHTVTLTFEKAGEVEVPLSALEVTGGM